MKVIAVTGQKGGSGKTTLAVNLAAWFTTQGLQASVLDRDPQGAVVRWDGRGDGLPFRIFSDLKAQLDAVVDARRHAGDDIAIIDTAPSIGGAFREVPRLADLIILPSTPSGPDVEALYTSYEILTGEFRHKRIVAVLTQVFANYKITKDAVAGLEALEIPLLAQVGHRTVYQVVATEGSTVFTASDKKASDEIAALGETILPLIKLKAKVLA